MGYLYLAVAIIAEVIAQHYCGGGVYDGFLLFIDRA